MRIHYLFAIVLFAAAGCRTPAPAPPPAPEPPPRRFAYPVVWTARPEVELRVDSVLRAIGPVLTRLEVTAADSATLSVRCAGCEVPLAGTVRLEDVVYQPLPPRIAARGTLAEFALAVREAIAAGDTAALRPVMAPKFTFSFVGEQGVDAALAAWASDGFRELADAPALLDRGLATRDHTLWAAPPEHLTTLGYTGPRLGFRRKPSGEWEWVFLVRGILAR